MTKPFPMRKAVTGAASGMAFALGLSLAGMALAEGAGLNHVDPGAGFAHVSRAYSDMDQNYVRDGNTRSLVQVRAVAIGASKTQLIDAVGAPVAATRDGSSWYFDIKLPLPQQNRLVCQYKVDFDDQERVSATIWRRPQCADLVTGRNG